MLIRLKRAVRVFLGHGSFSMPVKDKYCPVCDSKTYFLPIPIHFMSELHENECFHPMFTAETINLKHYECGNCGASDRDRLYALYFKKVLSSTGDQSFSLLDIAPSAPLSVFFKRQTKLKIRTADLMRDDVDDKVDVTRMTIYNDESFDIFICSHVLEHVDDDLAGMKELYRVLKKGGWGIAMVPILLGLSEIYENPTVTTEKERWKHFGQDDHARMYSKNGFVSRLETAGFKVEQLGESFFGKDVFLDKGIHHRSVLYVVRK
jgi:predicted SAM-dependent methyltransferase